MIEVKSLNSIEPLLDHTAFFSHDYPFISPLFFYGLEVSGSVGEKTGWIPFYLAAFDSDELKGFIPLFIKSHSYGEYVFDWAWADAFERHGLRYYPKLLSAIPFTPISGPRILACDDKVKKILLKSLEKILIDNNLSSGHFLFVNDDDKVIMENSNWMIRQGVQFRWRNMEYENFDQFLSNLSHTKRKKIKQDRKKINEFNIKVEKKNFESINKSDISFFYQCYCQTYREHNSRPYLTRQFFDFLFENFKDKLFMAIAKLDEENIAASLSIIGLDVLYGRYWGALKHIPSLHFELCYYQGQEFCIEKKLKYFEGGAQGEHKLARGFEPINTYSSHFVTQNKFKEAIMQFLNEEKNYMDIYSENLNLRSPFKKSI